MKKVPLLKIILVLFGCLIIAGLASLTTVAGIKNTSDAKFCSECHSMKAVTAAYYEDVHGGNNDDGFRVDCVACHLPHDSTFNYLKTKVLTGLHDISVEHFGDPSKVDWQKLRLRREKFTYESGCKSCHSNLEHATSGNTKAFVAHRPYFQGKTGKTCVTCHENVGHKNLTFHLSKTQKK